MASVFLKNGKKITGTRSNKGRAMAKRAGGAVYQGFIKSQSRDINVWFKDLTSDLKAQANAYAKANNMEKPTGNTTVTLSSDGEFVGVPTGG